MCRIDEDGHIDSSNTFATKDELINCLRTWLSDSRASTIGDVGSFGRRPWLRGSISAARLHLNADTNRRGVDAFIAMHDRDPDGCWHVVSNRNGSINKLAGPTSHAPTGKYAYLDTELDEEACV